MLTRLVELSVRKRALVFVLTAVLIGLGIWAALELPLDAVPDITSPQVQVNTAVGTLAPEEIERQVTFPIENEMSGLPGLKELRSLSKFGLSQVTMVFQDDVDLLRMRQLVSERLQTVADDLPAGLTPRLAPIATGLGEIFYYGVDYTAVATHKPATREAQLMELKLIQDFQIKPLLRQTRGVAEVNTSGGYDRQIIVSPDPAKLLGAGLSLTELADKIGENTRNAGGGLVEIGGEQIVIRANGRVTRLEEIVRLPLKFAGGAKPLLVGDVASVAIGASFRTGASTRNGEEAIVGAAIMMAGENSRLVSRAVAAKLKEIQLKLPAGVEIHALYDRSDLVNATIRTVETNLVEGALLVTLILFLLLGNLRAAVIVALAIPLSMLFAMLGMNRLGIPGNLMSLGAIDFGLIVDGAVVMAENILRHLGERQHRVGRALTARERLEEVLVSAKEVVNPMFFGVLIITVVYVPILALQGVEGKMFKPMAVVVMLAMGGALLLAVTLVPALCSAWLGGIIKEEDNWLVKATKALYTPLLRFGLRWKVVIVLPMIALFAGSALIFQRLGAEFIPQLEEGAIVLQMIRSSSAGLGASLAMQKQSERILLQEFPEIQEIYSRIGTAEIALDPMGPNTADTFILLKPKDQWRRVDGRPATRPELAKRMEQFLAPRVPGQSYERSQPIQLRFNEIMAGARADLVCKVFGDDYETIERLSGEVRQALLMVPGNGDPPLEGAGRTPMLEITPDRDALRRYALHADDVNRVVETALAGVEVGVIVEGNRRFPIVVRASDAVREDAAAMKRLPLATDGGGMLTLGQVASISNVLAVTTIARENAQRRIAILINVQGRDTASFVREASRAIHQKVSFPPGYYFEFGGQFENYLEAKRRLTIVHTLALGIIFVLIYLSFGSLRQAALIYICVPLAVTGGVFALALRGMPFTISAGVGFIALSGIAVLNGIMLISYINQLRRGGQNLRDAVVEGTLTRLRPKLMTALVASLGFVPMALATGAGAEVQRPLATVVIGGILTSTFLTLLVLPLLYEWLERKHEPADNSPRNPAPTEGGPSHDAAPATTA